MKYKNRLIVPTLISTALFGTALNAEAEEMSKEAHIQTEAVDIQDTEVSQKAEKRSTYINPKDVEPAEKKMQKEAAQQDEAPSVEEEPAQVSTEEDTLEILEEPTGQNTEETTVPATPETSSEDASSKDSDTEPVEASSEEASSSNENIESNPVEEEAQTLSEVSSEDEEQQENASDEEAVTQNDVKEEVQSDGKKEESTQEVNDEPDAPELEEDDREDDTSNPQAETSPIEETDLESGSEESAEEEIEQIEEDDPSDDGQNDESETSEDGEPIAEEMTDEDQAEPEASETEELSEEAETVKEDADVVEDPSKKKGLLTMFRSRSIEMSMFSASSTKSINTSESINAARFKGGESIVYKSYKDKEGTLRSEFKDYTLFTKERVDYNGTPYYSLYDAENNSFVGWAKEDAMHVYSKSSEVSHKKEYVVNNLDKSLLSVAFGDEKQQIDSYRDIGSYLFSAQKKVTVGALDYYYGSVGGQTGWAHYRHVTPIEAADHKKSSDSSAARTRSTSSDIVYATPYSIEGAKSSTLDDRTFFTKEKVTFKGEEYYSLHNPENDRLIGWMKEKDLVTHDRTEEKKHVKSYLVDNLDKHLLDVAYGDKKQRTGTYRNVGSHLFNAEKHVRVGSLDYYYGKIGDTHGWAHYAHVTPLDEVHNVRTNDQSAVRLKSSGGRTVMAQPYDVSGTVNTDNMDRTFYTKEKIEWKDNTLYSLHNAVTDKAIGWAKAEDLSVYSMSDAESHNESYIVEKIDKPLLTAAFGDEKQQIDSYRNIGSYLFEAEKRVKVGSLYYYYGKINDQYGWAHYAHVTPESAVTVDRATKSYAGRVSSRLTNGLYGSIYDIEGKSNTSITDTTLFTKERVRFKDRELYSVYDDIGGRFVGWLSADDLSLIPRSTVKKASSNFVVNDSSAYLFTAPYGTEKQRVNQLGSFDNDKFDAEKAVTIGGTTYYYGRIGNTSGWVAEGSVGEYIVENIKYGMTLEEAVDIQMNLRAKPQAWVSGGGWRNATRSEVERYINPANHTTDVWDYTYLDLNRAQNISTVELNNKLLNNKGILHNQGTAFLQAANTHGVNEVYLISHALHETGNGQSTLAQGVRLDENGNISENGKLYYNMYGIAAYDHNPVLEGARYAQRMGWDTPAKAVIGGAQFISGGYFNRGQNTLYAMRWNPANPGTYQYATDVNWAYATARNLKNYYDQLGIRGQYYTRYTF
ncbi:glucosaminidase domain-containing protein [Salinicoccus roseus]|uniref:N-acetylmuramoyl-L-alanine amidase n=1 Tax=Salinicoccus roseus TaxID=45670 RepID=A0A265E642_9STAP|nr:glucosaminidase domain-containing protein [Salinicoccus roseus]OZT76906.1 hypothetical protein CFN03_07450 [Salinicoccus roseus]